MRRRTYKNIACSVTAIAIATAGTVMMMAGCARTADYTGDDTASPAAVEAATADDAETAATEAMETGDVTGVGMPSPIADYETLEEAEKAAGFELTVPEAIDGYDEISYSVISDELIQVIYTNADGASITIRKAAGSDDISGDYNVYDDEQVQDVDGRSVTLRGSDGKVCLAIWTDGEYSYSVMTSDGEGLAASDAGMSLDEMSEIVTAVK